MSDGTLKLSTDVVALGKARYPEAEVSVSVWDGWTANTRFARNEPTTNGDVQETNLDVTVAFGNRHASASTNQTAEASVAAVIDRAATMARLSPEDAEWMPPLGKQAFAAVPEAFDPDVARLDAARRADKVGAAIAEAKATGVMGAGYLECDAHGWAIANSRGLSGFHRQTRAEMTMTARTADGTGSGWGARVTHRAPGLDAREVGRVASDKGARSANPRPLEPGRYTVVLEPAAVGELLEFFAGALDARRADEGRSFFSREGGKTKLGEKLFPEWITLESDPANPETPGAPFDVDGVRLSRVAWIDRGVVGALRYSRYWAAKRGKEPTGHHRSFLLRGGTAGRPEDLLASVKRGLLVTHFFYSRWLEPKAMSATGLTRDGVFLIEDGRVTGPVNNFRWNESPVNLLSNCEAMTAAVTRVSSEWGGAWYVPALRSHDFNMASVSAAV
jgi:predicted Zn-dependent protease